MESQTKIKILEKEEVKKDENLQFYQSPLFLTLFYSMGIGGSMYSAYHFVQNSIIGKLRQKFISKIEISSLDPLYEQIENHFNDLGFLKTKLNHLQASLQRKTGKYFWQDQSDFKTDKEKPKIKYESGDGHSIIYHQNVRIMLNVISKKPKKVGFVKKEVIEKVMTMQAFGGKSITVLQSLISDALEKSYNLKKDLIDIYAYDSWKGWNQVQTKQPRPFQSVILDQNNAELIRDDILNFKNTQEWYKQRGVPYRRGYLLYGPPGTGKTSFILAIAGDLKMNLCVLSLQDEDLTEEKLINSMETIPNHSLVLLEDVDAIFIKREANEKRKNNLSFSGLLNALDGVRTTDGRILFMTTNHKEKLDPALLRPGRADIHIELKNASCDQVYRLFLNFFPQEIKLATEFSKKIPQFTVSMAKLQGHFLQFKDDPNLILQNCNLLLEKFEEKIEHLTLKEWLLRFNFEKYEKLIIKGGIDNLTDLYLINEEKLKQIGINLEKDKKTLTKLLKHEFDEDFALITTQCARERLNFIYESVKDIDEILDGFQNNQISLNQLKQIISKNNQDQQELKKCLLQQFQHNKDFREGIFYYQKKLKFEPKLWIEQQGFIEFWPKILDEKFDSPELFIESDSDDLLQIMGVEKLSKKKFFSLRFTDLQNSLFKFEVFEKIYKV